MRRLKLLACLSCCLMLMTAETRGEELNLSLLIGQVSNSRESYLSEAITLSPMKLVPKNPVSGWEDLNKELKLGLADPWTYKIKGQENNLNTALATLHIGDNKEALQPEKLAPDRLSLASNILIALGLEGNDDALAHAIEYLEKYIELYPNGDEFKTVQYNLAIALLYKKDFDALHEHLLPQIALARRNGDMEWYFDYLNILTESYYQHRRFVRIEELMWDLANRIYKNDVPAHIASRYADSLFWLKKYDKLIEWHQEFPAIFSKDDSPENLSSQLYHYESLWQLSKTEEACQGFRSVPVEPIEDNPLAWVQYRQWQCQFINDSAVEPMEIYQQLKQTAAKTFHAVLRQSMQLQAARIAAIQGFDTDYEEMLELSSEIKKSPSVPELREEAELMEVVLLWRMKDKLKLHQAIVDATQAIRSESASIVIRDIANFTVSYLSSQAPAYWQDRNFIGFLQICDFLKHAIEISPQRVQLLLWISRSFNEYGMSDAAARLLNKLLFTMKLEDPDLNQVALELARSYLLFGEIKLAEKSLALISTLPSTQARRQLYYLIHAALAISYQDYAQCSQYFDELFKSGISGEDLFRYSVKAAQCARQAKQVDKAEQWLKLLGISDSAPAENPEIPRKILRWQWLGLSERLLLLGSVERDQEVIDLFEKIWPQRPEDFSFPLEAIFQVLHSYQKLELNEKANELWQNHAQEFDKLLEGFPQQYSDLLEMMQETQLLMLPVETQTEEDDNP